MTKHVYLAYTRNKQIPNGELVRVYGSLRQALAWLTDIGNRYKVEVYKNNTTYGNRTVAIVENPANGQKWWLHKEELA